MKAEHNKKSVRVEFVISEQEAALIKERMAELGITNLSAYFWRRWYCSSSPDFGRGFHGL